MIILEWFSACNLSDYHISCNDYHVLFQKEFTHPRQPSTPNILSNFDAFKTKNAITIVPLHQHGPLLRSETTPHHYPTFATHYSRAQKSATHYSQGSIISIARIASCYPRLGLIGFSSAPSSMGSERVVPRRCGCKSSSLVRRK